MKITIVKTKSQNSCKVCGRAVNNKNGIQCQGECKQWAHYICLNYDPQKIQNIKSGVLKVVCPCSLCREEEIQADINVPKNITSCDDNHETIFKSPNDKVKTCPAEELKDKCQDMTVENDLIPLCTIGKTSYEDTECDFSPEKHALKRYFKEPISDKDCGCLRFSRNPVEKSVDTSCLPRACPEEKYSQRHQNSHLNAKRNLDMQPEKECISLRIPAAPNCLDKKINKTKPEEPCLSPLSRKTRFTEPLPYYKEKRKPPCSCLTNIIQQHKPYCDASLSSSSDSSCYQHSPSKGINQSMINTLENVCHTVGLLSTQIRDLTCKIISLKHQNTV